MWENKEYGVEHSYNELFIRFVLIYLNILCLESSLNAFKFWEVKKSKKTYTLGNEFPNSIYNYSIQIIPKMKGVTINVQDMNLK